MGDFSLDNKKLLSIIALSKNIDHVQGSAGFFPEQIHPVHGLPLGLIARKNNYGSLAEKIPPRPFFTYALATCDNAVGDVFKRETVQLFHHSHGNRLRSILLKAAKSMENWIQVYILSDGLYPRNAPYTEKKKGFNRPLFETGYMAANVKSKVEKTL